MTNQPIRITAETPPQYPCEVQETNGHWHVFDSSPINNSANSWIACGWTHWRKYQPERPTVVPEQDTPGRNITIVGMPDRFTLTGKPSSYTITAHPSHFTLRGLP